MDGNVVDNFKLTPLHAATKCGHFEVVKLLAEHYPAHVNQVDISHNYPLHSAVQPLQSLTSQMNWTAKKAKDVPPPATEYLKIVKFLTEKMKCDPDCRNNDKSTPLHCACSLEDSSLEIIRFLVNEVKCDPTIRNITGTLPIHLACKNGRKDIVQFLLEPGKSIKDIKGPSPTSLHYAAVSDKPEVFMYLTKQGYNPLKYEDILQYAAVGGCLRTIEFLVHCGYCTTVTKKLTLTHACMHGHVAAVKYFIEECGWKTAEGILAGIAIAAERGHYEVVKYLMAEQKYCQNFMDQSGQTPLHYAVRGEKRVYGPNSLKHSCDNMKVIKLLVEDLKCDPNLPNIENISSLKLACMEDKQEVVQYFLTKCVVDKDNFGRTPLHWAAMGSAYRVAEYLVSSQLYSPMCKDNDKNTPLHLTASFGELSTFAKISRSRKLHREKGTYSTMDTMLEVPKDLKSSVTKYLIRAMRFDTSVTNVYGQAPIHLACVKGNASIVEDLQQTITLEDSIGRTPLHYAAMGGHVNIARNLIYFNADLLSEDVFHNLPLHYAAALGHLDVVQFLVNIGSPLTAKGVRYKTPAEMAAAGGHKNVLDYLNSQQSKTICMCSKIVFCT